MRELKHSTTAYELQGIAVDVPATSGQLPTQMTQSPAPTAAETSEHQAATRAIREHTRGRERDVVFASKDNHKQQAAIMLAASEAWEMSITSTNVTSFLL